MSVIFELAVYETSDYQLEAVVMKSDTSNAKDLARQIAKYIVGVAPLPVADEFTTMILQALDLSTAFENNPYRHNLTNAFIEFGNGREVKNEFA